MSFHTELLGLIEHSGPFLTEPVLGRAFPQGIDALDRDMSARLRCAYESWLEERERLHTDWINMVFTESLGYGKEILRQGGDIPSSLTIPIEEHQAQLKPDMLMANPTGCEGEGKPRMLIQIWPPSQKLGDLVQDQKWAASPKERMTILCKATGVRLGLSTNGEEWLLVDAVEGKTPAFASWYSSLWFQEPITLRGFQTFLSARRFFGVSRHDTIESLLDESAEHQQEVTDQLGLQVRQAVEVLIQALDRADRERARELLRGVSSTDLYGAALTVMMRLVFLFSAEERDLLLLGDKTYDNFYAVSTLRGFLRKQADEMGLEVLERRYDAWARLLATFRAIYGGIQHDDLRLPALGGSLFDPNRYPFLEGRAAGTSWRDTPAFPLPIDNRTVLHLLESLQLLRKKGTRGVSEARQLSFRGLDIEQIGHVYEGLLDHIAVRVEVPTLGLKGAQGREPEISLEELETKTKEGEDSLVAFLNEHTKRSASALKNDLNRPIDEHASSKLLSACSNDESLVARLLPFHVLIREDVWGFPVVYQAGSFIVTGGPDRRETGTHYTPRVLTEEIVRETLTPLVYDGPAEAKEKKDWKLKSSKELLDLKICDMAMGSAAFLVQVCIWLGERIVEAWGMEESQGKCILADGSAVDRSEGKELLSKDKEDRFLTAKRLIAEKCIYGVDINPMAVELAKLSIWLVTMAKGRPFGFLDHNLRCGDSLLGIYRLDQLTKLSFQPDKQKQMRVFGGNIETAVAKAQDIRKNLRETRILDIRDVEYVSQLDQEAKTVVKDVEFLSDAMIAELLRFNADDNTRNSALDSLAVLAEGLLRGNVESRKKIREIVTKRDEQKSRKPFHWPLEFPEVFDVGGFNAVVGNPPYLGGRRIRRAIGDHYLEYLTRCLFVGVSANADLCAFFIRRAFNLIRAHGTGGFVATSSMSEGDTRDVCLQHILDNEGSIIRAAAKQKWPGTASVTFSPIWIYKSRWNGGFFLDNKKVHGINSYLGEPTAVDLPPFHLKVNFELKCPGSIPLGKGFVITDEEATALLKKDSRNADVIYPYLVGQELNIHPTHEPSQWIINFHDWPIEKARQYADCFRIVTERVKPYRDQLLKKSKQIHEYDYWKFWDKRPELYLRLSQLKWALAIATQATKYVAFGVISGKKIYSNAVTIITSDKYALAGVLASTLHEIWSRRYGGYNLLLLRYSSSDLFGTFPFPLLSGELENVGQRYYDSRRNIMIDHNEGLTATYNRFNDPGEDNLAIKHLRELQIELDQTVVDAYGWNDLNLNHDFRETSQGLRFTLGEEARREVLERLLILNHQRYKDEVNGGLKSKQKARKTRKKSELSAGQAELL